MIFRPYYDFDKGCAAYLFGCGTLGRCAVVDARADDIDSYIAFAHDKNVRITHAIRRFHRPVHSPDGRSRHRAREHARHGAAHPWPLT